MGIFDKIFGKAETNGKKPGSQDVITAMLTLADVHMEQGDFVQAVATYKNIVGLQPNTTAQYNLGSLYAQGKGVEQSYLEGAYWFHQASLVGDAQAEKLCTKCMLEYAHQNIHQKTPRAAYEEMIRFASYLYPREDSTAIAARNLFALAGHHFNKKEYRLAALFFRAAAEFCNHGDSQNYLAVLYNAGAGVEKDDLAALYWFDRAVDNGCDAAKRDRIGIFHAYKDNNSPAEFYDIMMTLSGRCVRGDADIPKDAEKAAYWRAVGEGKSEKS